MYYNNFRKGISLCLCIYIQCRFTEEDVSDLTIRTCIILFSMLYVLTLHKYSFINNIIISEDLTKVIHIKSNDPSLGPSSLYDQNWMVKEYLTWNGPVCLYPFFSMSLSSSSFITFSSVISTFYVCGIFIVFPFSHCADTEKKMNKII